MGVGVGVFVTSGSADPSAIAPGFGVAVGFGVGDGVGVGFVVGVGGGPRHTLSPMMVRKFCATGVVVDPPPPQLMISAAARKDSTGTSTRHRRRQIIKPSTMTAHTATVKPRAAALH